MLFSLIIPVYKRPKEEIDELLQSLSIQTYRSFEILIVEDFSPIPCESVVNIYKNMVDIQYFYKENSGPGPSRNYGSLRAKGDYFIFLDSDCIIPEKYLAEVQKSIADDYTDCFGGPDKAHPNFTDIQKAINYSMTSFFTTGGIRGGGEKLDTFYPRSFNMGYSRVVFEKTGGFANLPYGESEDIDMSIRIIKNGFRTKLIKTAFVYHKRRTNFVQFFKQTYRFGKSRVSLFLKYPDSLKIVHILPSCFALFCITALITDLFFMKAILLFYFSLIFVDSLQKNKSMRVAFMSIIAAFIQLFSYGMGFIIKIGERIFKS